MLGLLWFSTYSAPPLYFAGVLGALCFLPHSCVRQLLTRLGTRAEEYLLISPFMMDAIKERSSSS